MEFVSDCPRLIYREPILAMRQVGDGDGCIHDVEPGPVTIRRVTPIICRAAMSEDRIRRVVARDVCHARTVAGATVFGKEVVDHHFDAVAVPALRVQPVESVALVAREVQFLVPVGVDAIGPVLPCRNGLAGAHFGLGRGVEAPASEALSACPCRSRRSRGSPGTEVPGKAHRIGFTTDTLVRHRGRAVSSRKVASRSPASRANATSSSITSASRTRSRAAVDKDTPVPGSLLDPFMAGGLDDDVDSIPGSLTA